MKVRYFVTDRFLLLSKYVIVSQRTNGYYY